MFDTVMKLREPAAWTVIAVTVGTILLALVRFGLALAANAPLDAASQDVALNAMNLTLVITIVALVWACVFVAPTPRATRLVGVAATVVTFGTLLTIVATVLGAGASAGVVAMALEILGGLLVIVLKVVAVVTLWLIRRGMRGGRIGAAVVGAGDSGQGGWRPVRQTGPGTVDEDADGS